MQPASSVQALLFSVPVLWSHVTHGYKVLGSGALGSLEYQKLMRWSSG